MSAHTSTATTAPRLQLTSVTKAYSWGLANEAIDLTVLPGEIHAILGENGAGKSTLMKIIFGVVQPTAGTIQWEGHAIVPDDPAHMRALGVGMVFQHFSLFETLSVVENVSLTVPGDLPTLAERITALAQRYRLPVDPHQGVHALSVGERQRVEILRALLQAPKLLILDEPTSVLTPQAITGLFDTLRQLASEGCSILYISHKLDEIRELCHRATVLRAGRVTGTTDPRQASAQDLARMMIGQDLVPTDRGAPRPLGEARLEVSGLRLVSQDNTGAGIHLTVHAGEIVGIAGIAGNGQQELLASLSGEHVQAQDDVVCLDGHAAGQLDAGARRAMGLCFVPEERLGRASVPPLSLTANALLTGFRRGMVNKGWLRLDAAREFARQCIQSMGVKASSEAAIAAALSGGNLQKFILAREMLQRPRVLIVAQPTWGVDVGAARELRQRLIDLRNDGGAILVVSEDLDELFELSDRLGVLHRGQLSPLYPINAVTRDQVGMLMAGTRTGKLDSHENRDALAT